MKKFSNELRKEIFDRLGNIEFLILDLKSLVQNEMPIVEKDIEEYSKKNNVIISELNDIQKIISSEFEKEDVKNEF